MRFTPCGRVQEFDFGHNFGHRNKSGRDNQFSRDDGKTSQSANWTCIVNIGVQSEKGSKSLDLNPLSGALVGIDQEVVTLRGLYGELRVLARPMPRGFNPNHR
jgi:hypothetical protein